MTYAIATGVLETLTSAKFYISYEHDESDTDAGDQQAREILIQVARLVKAERDRDEKGTR
jgi:hypothetical protein